MASITTRLSLRTKNVFSNSFVTRHDKVTSVNAEADRRIKTIKAASGAPATLVDATDYHDAGTETVFVFVKNTTATNNKFLYIKIGSQVVAKLKPASYILLHWYVADASTDITIYSNDSTNGVKVEYFVVKEST